MSINSSVRTRKLHWNNFPLHHTFDFSGRFGKLIPVQCLPVVAGDLIDESIEFNMRLAPLSAPAMARFNVHFHSFYVPYRILSPRSGSETTWEKFVLNTGREISEAPTLPHFRTPKPVPVYLNRPDEDVANSVSVDELSVGSLWDYMQLPVIPKTSSINEQFFIDTEALRQPGLNAWNFLAYLKIWNDWYRRDQIEEEVVFPLDLSKIDLFDNEDTAYTEPELPENVKTPFDIKRFIRELMKLRTRNYERDYFTSGLPEPQFGDDVLLGGGQLTSAAGAYISLSAVEPLAGYIVKDSYASNPPENAQWDAMPGLPSPYDTVLTDGNGSLSSALIPFGANGSNSINFNVIDTGGLQAAPFSVNELRMAFQLQGVREKINRGGTRYVEIMKSVFGVTISDLRLQRPQFLGGTKAPINIGAVIQTSESGTTPQGNMTGMGGATGGTHLFRTKRIFEEPGVLMTIMSVTPRTGYFGGIPRQYLKFDPIDYYVPDLDHLGEQETYKAELYFPFNRTVNANGIPNDGKVDGIKQDPHIAYNPHYQEYKSAYSTVAGEFRTTLDNWNVFREFDAPPVLSPDFIHAEPEDFDRIFQFENVANTSNEHFYCQLYFKINAKRPMSKYSTPYTFF